MKTAERRKKKRNHISCTHDFSFGDIQAISFPIKKKIAAIAHIVYVS